MLPSVKKPREVISESDGVFAGNNTSKAAPPLRAYSLMSHPHQPSKKEYERYLELEFGPGFVDRLKSKFASASSAAHSYATVQAGLRESPPTPPVPVKTPEIPPIRPGKVPSPRKLDSILQQKLLMTENVLIIDRAPTAAPAMAIVKLNTHHLTNNSLAAELVNKSECIEGLVSQYKAIFDGMDPVPAQRRKRLSAPLSSVLEVPTASSGLNGHVSVSTSSTTPDGVQKEVTPPVPPPRPKKYSKKPAFPENLSSVVFEMNSDSSGVVSPPPTSVVPASDNKDQKLPDVVENHEKVVIPRRPPAGPPPRPEKPARPPVAAKVPFKSAQFDYSTLQGSRMGSDEKLNSNLESKIVGGSRLGVDVDDKAPRLAGRPSLDTQRGNLLDASKMGVEAPIEVEPAKKPATEVDSGSQTVIHTSDRPAVKLGVKSATPDVSVLQEFHTVFPGWKYGLRAENPVSPPEMPKSSPPALEKSDTSSDQKFSPPIVVTSLPDSSVKAFPVEKPWTMKKLVSGEDSSTDRKSGPLGGKPLSETPAVAMSSLPLPEPALQSKTPNFDHEEVEKPRPVGVQTVGALRKTSPPLVVTPSSAIRKTSPNRVVTPVSTSPPKNNPIPVKKISFNPQGAAKPKSDPQGSSTSRDSSTDSEKENTTPQRVVLKKTTGYGMTTIMDTKSRPIGLASPALKIDDPALLTSLRDIGRSSPVGGDSSAGEDALDVELMQLIVVGHNSPTGSRSSLKSAGNSRTNLRITFNDGATKTHEYPSERSLLGLDLTVTTSSGVVTLDVELEESDTDGITMSDTPLITREGDLLRRPNTLSRPSTLATNGLSSYKPSAVGEFQLGMERPTFPSEKPQNSSEPSIGIVNGPRPPLHVRQQALLVKSAPQPRAEQFRVQSSADDGNFSHTTSDADDLLF